MYGNMTREEMIQRLYKGDFATGELERQLIAKIFEKCCGGGSGGGVSIIGEIGTFPDTSLDKTAAEIIEMAETGIIVLPIVEDNGDEGTSTYFYYLDNIQDLRANGEGILIGFSGGLSMTYVASDLDEYPHHSTGNGGPSVPS